MTAITLGLKKKVENYLKGRLVEHFFAFHPKSQESTEFSSLFDQCSPGSSPS